MNTITIPQKKKNKHLEFVHYEYIINEIIKFNASTSSRRNSGRTALIRKLADNAGTTVSNIYSIIKDATITVRDTYLRESTELSAMAAFQKRSRNHKLPNNSKLDKALPFIELVSKEIKSNKLSGIDETINYLIRHEPEKLEGMTTVCTKTFYNYVHQDKIGIKPIDLPRMLRRKPKKNDKDYIPKGQKGTSIEERPDEVETREEFGHWEGDLVVGPRNGRHGAYLTLIERKTRFFLMLYITRKSSKLVYMKINQLNKFYGDRFPEIFKSITFDNGAEFSRYRDIEKKPGEKNQRTKVYFGRPYHSCDRASNENCNALIRYFIPKGTDIDTISKEMTLDINNKINNKKRKINNYLSSETLFLEELRNIGVTSNAIFYKS